MRTRRSRFRLARWVVLALGAGLLLLPSAGTSKNAFAPGHQMLAHMSQGPSFRYYASHLDQAPAGFQERFEKIAKGAKAGPAQPAASVAGVFNNDTVGLPQNEESVAACRGNTNIVLGGTNDYRGLLDPQENFTGWHLSTDGGASLAKEGLLPAVQVSGVSTPSGGDPVDVADADCNLYAGSLNYDPFTFFPSGVGVYKTTPATLSSCPGGSDPSCWPTRRSVSDAPDPNHFFDKEWIDVGESGAAGRVVWVVYSDFLVTDANPAGFTASIMAVRCDANLVSCTAPILISGSDQDIQFGDVTIGPDGRTYITWSEIQGELEGTAQTFVHKLRIAPAGSTVFGKTRTVATEKLPLPFGGFLHANDFRIATYPKNSVVMVGGKPRIFVVWDGCSARPFDVICEEPQIKLTYSDTDGAAWTRPKAISSPGDNYFPTIASDGSGKLAVAWYTNRFDATFHNRQDVELATVNASTAAVTNTQRLETESNETEADPLLGGFFIGDYFEAFANNGTAWVHFNANYRSIQLLGQGFAIPQQDNYLLKRNL